MKNVRKNLILGSYNSLSYLKPSNRYGKLFRFKEKYQRKTIKEQYFEYGIRAFDVKIFFDDKGRGYFKIGKSKYETYSIFENLWFFNDMKDCIVMITLEESKEESNKCNIDSIEKRFKDICHIFEVAYPNIYFIGGKRSYDGKEIYRFSNNQYSSYNIESLYKENKSKYKRKLRKICPFIHAKLYNENNYINLIGKNNIPMIVFADYVDIR